MASLNKLAIRGIRSFDDKNIAIIEFFSPVTVIVGHNGSGKTTIIECLKYATTGDQPPNTRGGAFVHDPKMANEKEVKAQVKLRFHAANGKRMLVVRNLSVTMKKNNALTMKTLEGILSVADADGNSTGKRGTISTKCAEIDSEIPSLLGVSKAVLENVIFCHQEDSYWPLSEPSVLKKKFDDIFEASKYTKALDSIKALRKDRVAELKAETERLDGLRREKQHADKLKSRIADLNSTIAAKEVEYEKTKKEYEKVVTENQQFHDSATKFRETYVKIEELEKTRDRLQQELSDNLENLQEVEGTEEELAERLRGYDEHIAKQKQKQKSEESKLEGIEEDLARARKQHVELVSEQGRLQAEEKAQEQRISDREELIREISAQYQLKGYDHSPLEREKVLEFITKLGDLRRKQNAETDKLQNENKTANEEYSRKANELRDNLQALKHQKQSLWEKLKSLQSGIVTAEQDIDAAQTLNSQLRTLQGDMEEKQRRLDSTKAEIQSAKYEERISEKSTKARTLDAKRDTLSAELSTLSLQADSRAKLTLKRDELKSTGNELKNVLEANNDKFRKLTGVDAHPATMESELDRLASEKERESSELESRSNVANKNLQTAETTLSNLKARAKALRDEVSRMNKEIEQGIERDDGEKKTLAESIEEASEEVNMRQGELGRTSGAHTLYRRLLTGGVEKKCCPLCTRDMNAQEIDRFEKNVKENIRRSAPEQVKELERELKEWEGELQRLQDLAVVDKARQKIASTELPAIERQIKEQEAELPAITAKAEEIQSKLDTVKKELRDISVLRQHANAVSRMQKDVDRLTREIGSIEGELSVTGSTKSPEDVQQELDSLSTEIRANEREKQALTSERERQVGALRTLDSDLQRMRLEKSEMKNQLRDRADLEKRIADMRKDITSSNTQLKELDTKIADAQVPITHLEQEHNEAQREINSKISQAQQLAQDLNMSVDKLENINRSVERYVRDRKGRRLEECNSRIAEYETEITSLNLKLEEVRHNVEVIKNEIAESGAFVVNLRENIRARKLKREITATQTSIDSYDMEDIAKQRRLFNERWNVEKQKETALQSKSAHIGGEVSSLKGQVEVLLSDSKEFEHVAKKYRDQLIKVKMSDMANNDLEKYAKALDNAIMKYHSLKMEEVNDTMRHLWNKTYQGTDIDGIKISADNEGGATKRTYNYRVVMTKDQVEMDMRGRCSAGQKMLASIIIRLALADSFGQNCGILALDEPTNALDTENIDALAASLVDIINERKSNANFQLIIITHDENFLRKLGQSDVMEYYWRVSRDSRQKSIIERHRFG